MVIIQQCQSLVQKIIFAILKNLKFKFILIVYRMGLDNFARTSQSSKNKVKKNV